MRIIGWDTETYKGKAVLITKPHSFYEPKSWDGAIGYIAQDRETACFNADYDIQAILKFLPKAARDRLAMLNEVRYGVYRIRYIPHKFLKVWALDMRGEDRLILNVYDMRQFYNMSLQRVAEKLELSIQKTPLPMTWYRNMKARLEDPKTREKVLEYALDDARILQQVIDRTVEAFKVVGMRFEKPYSNASFAERYFKKRLHVRRHEGAERMARAAYHGGRIECLKAGFFENGYLYDINSAYPSVIARLVKPDGSWLYGKKVRKDCVYAFIDCILDIPEDERLGPIPVRKQLGAIVYPVGKFRKTVTLTEYRYLEKRGFIKKVLGVVQHCWPHYKYPFEEVEELYRRRKENPKTAYAIKIILNALYGKFAQVLTNRVRVNVLNKDSELFDGHVYAKVEKMRSHTSFVYASEITAQNRIRLIESFPQDKVIFYATDGVMTTEEVDIDQGPALGQWGEHETVRDLLVIGSGVYQYTTDEGEVVKARGFRSGIDFKKRLRQAGHLHRVPLRVMRNTSLKQAMKDSHALNVLEEQTRYLNVNFDRKRRWPHKWTARQITENQYESEPWIYYKPVRIII